MRILLATSDLLFLYHPHTPSRSLAVRRPTCVRGVGLGFASRKPQVVPTELDFESSRHNGISLGITRQVPRNYLSLSWRAARDAPAHAKNRTCAHAGRCSPTLPRLATYLHYSKSPGGNGSSHGSRPPGPVTGVGHPPLPITGPKGHSPTVQSRESATYRSSQTGVGHPPTTWDAVPQRGRVRIDERVITSRLLGCN